MPNFGRRGTTSRKSTEAYDAKQIVRKCNSIIRSIEVGLKKLESDIIASLASGSGSDLKAKAAKSRARSPSDLEWQPVPRPTNGPRVKYSSKQTLQNLQQRRQRQGTSKRSKATTATTDDDPDQTDTDKESSLSNQLKNNPLADRQQLFNVTPRAYWSSQEKLIETFIDTLWFPGRMLASLPDSRKPSELERACLRAYATGFDLDADWDDPEWGSVQYYSGLLELLPGGERFLPHVACHHGVRLFARAVESKWFPDHLASHLVSVALDMKRWIEAEYLLTSLLAATPQKLPRSINPNNIVPFPLDTCMSHPEILIRAVDKILFDRPNWILEPWFLRFWKFVAGQYIVCPGFESLTIHVLQLALALPPKTNTSGIHKNHDDASKLFGNSDAASLAQDMVTVLMKDILRTIVTSEGSDYGNFGGIANSMIARLIEQPCTPSMESTNRIIKVLFIIPMLFVSPSNVDMPLRILQSEVVQCLMDGGRSTTNKNVLSLEDDEEDEPNLNDMASSIALVLFSLPYKQGYTEYFQQMIRNNIRTWLWRLGTFLFRFVWQEAENRKGIENTVVSPMTARVASMSTSVRKFTVISKFISSVFGQLASLDDNDNNNKNKYPWSDYEKSIESLLTSIPMDHSCLDTTSANNQNGTSKQQNWTYEDMVGTWVARSPDQKKCSTRFSVVIKRSTSRLSTTTLRCDEETLPEAAAHQHRRPLRKRHSCPMPVKSGQPEQLHLPRGKRPRRSINYAVSSSSSGESDSASTSDKEESQKLRSLAPMRKTLSARRQFIDAVVIEHRRPSNTNTPY